MATPLHQDLTIKRERSGMNCKLERLVWFCLGFPAFFAGLWCLEVLVLPWTKWLPGGGFLGLAFSMWLGGTHRKPNAQISGGTPSAESDCWASPSEGK
jgi:hypothetical protein